jgi:hypothetical protein
MKLKIVLKGGSGSGNKGHAGRPGEVGGSGGGGEKPSSTRGYHTGTNGNNGEREHTGGSHGGESSGVWHDTSPTHAPEPDLSVKPEHMAKIKAALENVHPIPGTNAKTIVAIRLRSLKRQFEGMESASRHVGHDSRADDLHNAIDYIESMPEYKR